MFARLSAALGLLCIFVSTAFSEKLNPPPGTLLVYVNGGANQNSATLPLMRREAEKLLRSAGYEVEWRDTKEARIQETVPNLVFVEFQGPCSLTASPVPIPEQGNVPLASTPMVDGIVLPFSRIDCLALTRFLGPMLLREPPAQRTYYYGRAMGRLVAHELYHVLAQTRDHADAGVGKPCFTASDLVMDRFEFESVALARLRPGRHDTASELRRTVEPGPGR